MNVADVPPVHSCLGCMIVQKPFLTSFLGGTLNNYIEIWLGMKFSAMIDKYQIIVHQIIAQVPKKLLWSEEATNFLKAKI